MVSFLFLSSSLSLSLCQLPSIILLPLLCFTKIIGLSEKEDLEALDSVVKKTGTKKRKKKRNLVPIFSTVVNLSPDFIMGKASGVGKRGVGSSKSKKTHKAALRNGFELRHIDQVRFVCRRELAREGNAHAGGGGGVGHQKHDRAFALSPRAFTRLSPVRQRGEQSVAK